MAKYTVKRLLQSLVTILIVVTIVFLLLRMLPTDYFFTEDQLMKLTDQQKHDQLKAAGLLDSTFTQLTRYYGQLLRLDFGTSRRIQSGVSVVKVIGGKFAMSMQLGLISFAISLVIGVIMGVLQARFKDGIIDGIGTIYTILVNAVPPLVAYSLVLVFGSHVLKLPSMYSTRNPGPSMILPVACLSLSSIGVTRRYMGCAKDYIGLAGSSSKFLLMCLEMMWYYSTVGIGTIFDAINRYDTNVVQTLVILYAALGIIGVFLGDVLMMIIDPRITLTGKEVNGS